MSFISRVIGDFIKKADMVLLLLCTVTTIFGIVIIASATTALGNSSYISVQIIALILGILMYILLTLIDVDIIAERRELLLIFCVLFIGSLFFFGEEVNGNKSWLDIPLLPMNIQPAEICKIFFIIILAKMMNVNQNKLSSPLNVGKMALLTGFFFAYIFVISSDAGVALIYVFIFITMAFAGGVNLIWFLLGIGAVAFAVTAVFAVPAIQDKLVGTHWYERIMMFFDPSIDPYGKGVRWHTNLSLQYVQNGGVAGRGLFQGTMVQGRTMPAQHTDFIFSSIAEELGLIGCVAVLLMLAAIVTRIIYVGVKSGNYMNRIICIGIAGMLLFQIMVNVGMCLGLFPVIGLTLPFISYGGSSIVTMYMAMGVVSGIHMRPAPDGTARYIRPKTMLS